MDKRKGGKTILKSGQESTLPAQLGQLKNNTQKKTKKTGYDGKRFLRSHL